MSADDLKETRRLLQVVHDLRQKCPWDKKQTHESLSPYLLEETYEALEAIDSQNHRELKEEMGDLLLQIALHSEIANETSSFDFEEVAKTIADKMVHRHPHVYEDVKVKDDVEVKKNWVNIKRKEKPDRLLLDGIPKALPSLQLSQKYGYRASTVGFDWPSIKGVLEKVEEEKTELAAEIEKEPRDPDLLEMELGDLLFSLVNLARHLKIDAENALRKSAGKFYNRLHTMDTQVRKDGKKLADLSSEELETLWISTKKQADG